MKEIMRQFVTSFNMRDNGKTRARLEEEILKEALSDFLDRKVVNEDAKLCHKIYPVGESGKPSFNYLLLYDNKKVGTMHFDYITPNFFITFKP